MTLLVGVDNLSGGDTTHNAGAGYARDGGYVAVESGTATQLRLQVNNTLLSTSAIMAIYRVDGAVINLVGQTATFTPATGWNNINLQSPVSITQGVTYWLLLHANNSIRPVNGGPQWACADFPSTFPALQDPLDTESSVWSGSVQGFNIYADGTTGPSAATLSDPTPSGTLETQTTATIGCTTDQSTGTLYVVVDSAANMAGITDAQIIAGTNANDATPVFDGSGAISTTSPSVGATGLVANTAYAYAIVQVNDNGESNVVSGTFTTAEEAAQEVDGDGDFAIALVAAQAGTGQAAARKLRLTEVNELELRSETGALITASGVNFEWYDKFGNTTGEPDVTGSFDVVNGEAVVPLFGSVLDEGQPGTLILYHPSLNTVNGLYRLLVE